MRIHERSRGMGSRRLLAVCVMGLLAAVIAGCGEEKDSGTKSPAVPSSSATPAASSSTDMAASLNGAGSSFQAPLEYKWISEYTKLHPKIALNYQSIGSGAGIRQVTAGTIDFGGTDGPMTQEQLDDFKKARGCDCIHLPIALGAVMPTYNIPNVTAELKFTPAALAGIYMGTITKWNDPAITGPNAGVTLPDNDIVVVHRSDGSGTTYTWTDYLSKVSPEWKDKVGCAVSVKWPVGIGGKGNEGVAGDVTKTPYSIGYVELIYALKNHMTYGSVQNSAGKFIHADLDSTSAAAAGAAASMPSDFRVSITNAPGDATYPIVTFTWIMVPSKIDDPAKKAAMVDFLKWALNDGQSYCKDLAYASVPKEVVGMEMKAIEGIK
ncbi:MAG: phosphate ABC transporter substrate-binding protein PstS [Planctomycetota bacterium]